MANVNKADLSAKVAEQTGLSQTAAKQAIDAITENITSALKAGDTITLVGFGTFSTSDRAAREGRNPQTGKPLKIAASTVAKFKAGKALKDAVNS